MTAWPVVKLARLLSSADAVIEMWRRIRASLPGPTRSGHLPPSSAVSDLIDPTISVHNGRIVKRTVTASS